MTTSVEFQITSRAIVIVLISLHMMAFAVKTDGEWWIRSSAKCVMVIAGSDTRHRGLERGKYFVRFSLL